MDEQAGKKSEPATEWTFQPDDSGDSAPASQAAVNPVEPVSWTASEFIHHQKSTSWYVILGLATVVFAGLVYLITRDKISTSVVLIAAIIFGIYAGRKPRTLQYQLDDKGLTIGLKFYSYANFKSYAVASEGAFSSIVLMPLKRFMPAISLYYEPKDEVRIANILSERLPVEDHKRDAVDSLMHRIRF